MNREEQKRIKSHPRWLRWSERLADAISTMRKINKRSNISFWPASLAQIYIREGVPVKRIRKVLFWYCQVLIDHQDRGHLPSDTFIPVAYTAKTFREKFPRIEAAMLKREPFNGKDEPKIKVSKVIVSDWDEDPEDW